MVALSGSDRRSVPVDCHCEEQVAPQAVGATGESPKDDRQDAGPTQDARPTGNPRSFGDRFPSFPMGLQ